LGIGYTLPKLFRIGLGCRGGFTFIGSLAVLTM
jgi:hypothetical protein